MSIIHEWIKKMSQIYIYMIYIAYIYIIYRFINLEIRLVVSNVKREVERAKIRIWN